MGARQRVPRLVRCAESEAMDPAVEALQLSEATDRGPAGACDELEQLLALLGREGAHGAPKPLEGFGGAMQPPCGDGVTLPIVDVNGRLACKHTRKVVRLYELGEAQEDVTWHCRLEARKERRALPLDRAEETPFARQPHELLLVLVGHLNVLAARNELNATRLCWAGGGGGGGSSGRGSARGGGGGDGSGDRGRLQRRLLGRPRV
mmetsp:Transcript_23778/g.47453  ORF Transcript_23778/g.47453 Transcript_23778/m.47453 type:complete len:206 (+) Transcript_23778:402-1019(+)